MNKLAQRSNFYWHVFDQDKLKLKKGNIDRRAASFKSVEQLKSEYSKVIKELNVGTYTIREIVQLAAVAKKLKKHRILDIPVFYEN